MNDLYHNGEMRLYLLIGGHSSHVPEYTTEGWIGCFDTEDEAASQVEHNGKHYVINGDEYDWHDIVNLGSWINR